MEYKPVQTIKALQGLVDILPPPVAPVVKYRDVGQWNHFFAQLGTRLPEDYVQFHRLYGIGAFSSVSHPMSAGLNIFYEIADTLGPDKLCPIHTLNQLRLLKERYPKRVPFDLYFSPGGLLPWGKTWNDTLLCWRVSGSLVDDWPVVLLRPAKGQYEEYGKGMGRFLAGMISGDFESELMPKGMPGTKGVVWDAAVEG